MLRGETAEGTGPEEGCGEGFGGMQHLLDAELAHGVVHQHRHVLHGHTDVPVGPAALIRPVLSTFTLRGEMGGGRLRLGEKLRRRGRGEAKSCHPPPSSPSGWSPSRSLPCFAPRSSSRSRSPFLPLVLRAKRTEGLLLGKGIGHTRAALKPWLMPRWFLPVDVSTGCVPG